MQQGNGPADAASNVYGSRHCALASKRANTTLRPPSRASSHHPFDNTSCGAKSAIVKSAIVHRQCTPSSSPLRLAIAAEPIRFRPCCATGCRPGRISFPTRVQICSPRANKERDQQSRATLPTLAAVYAERRTTQQRILHSTASR